jgi:hypothetical protein
MVQGSGLQLTGCDAPVAQCDMFEYALPITA